MQALRRKGLAWEKDLDPQREHQLLREGIFWHDKTLDGLSDDDRPDWVVPKRKEGEYGDTYHLPSVGKEIQDASHFIKGSFKPNSYLICQESCMLGFKMYIEFSPCHLLAPMKS